MLICPNAGQFCAQAGSQVDVAPSKAGPAHASHHFQLCRYSPTPPPKQAGALTHSKHAEKHDVMFHPAFYTIFCSCSALLQAILSHTWSRDSPGAPHILQTALGSTGITGSLVLLHILPSRHGWKQRHGFDLEAHLVPAETMRRGIAAFLGTDCQ